MGREVGGSSESKSSARAPAAAAALEDYLSRAEDLKQAGNALLARNADAALARYREGLDCVAAFQEKSEALPWRRRGELRPRAEAVYLALHLNCAQACLKRRDWAGCIQHAEQALQVDADSVKALYRRGVALAQQGAAADRARACRDFERLLELDPQNASAQEHLDRLRNQLLSFYDLLGAHPEATSSQLKQAYYREAKRWHPDKAAPEDKALATQRFKDIAEAHEVLRDGELRELYDLYLQYQSLGYVEIDDPEDPHGRLTQVSFDDWADFRRLFEHGFTASDARKYDDRGDNDPDDPPLSVWEWLLGGGAFLAVWCFFAARHNHRQWLKCLPADIYWTTTEYSIPMCLLMSPLFFANVPWQDTVQWMRGAMTEDGVLP